MKKLNDKLAYNESLAYRKDMEKYGPEYDLNITSIRMDRSREILSDIENIDQFQRKSFDNWITNSWVNYPDRDEYDNALSDAPYINPNRAVSLYKEAIQRGREEPHTISIIIQDGLFSLSHVDTPLSVRVWYQAIQTVKKDRGGIQFRNILKNAVRDIEETTLFPKSKLFTQIVVDQTHDDNGRSHAENKRFDEAYERFELTGEIDFTPDKEC